MNTVDLILNTKNNPHWETGAEKGSDWMKILSKKKYSKLLEDFEELKNKCKDLERVNKKLEEKLEDKKTSCKENCGKEFCFKCKNSYRYKTYWNTTEIERCGCLLTVSCEKFERLTEERRKTE